MYTITYALKYKIKLYEKKLMKLVSRKVIGHKTTESLKRQNFNADKIYAKIKLGVSFDI